MPFSGVWSDQAEGLVFRFFCCIPVGLEVDMREKVIIFGKDT